LPGQLTADLRRERERRSAVIRRIPRANTFVRIAVLVCAFAPLSRIVRELNAQAALTVPAGLPDRAFNIPDKIQPTAVRGSIFRRRPQS